MNKIELDGKRDFPFTTNVLKFMQDANSMLEKFAAFGGDNYILSGCVNASGVISSGFMVLNGILMPFTGGVVQEYLKIVETNTEITVDTGTRNEITYHAEFGTSTNSELQFEWATIDAHRFYNLLEIKAKFATELSAIDSRFSAIDDKLSDTDWVDAVPIIDMTTFDVQVRKKNGFVIINGSFQTNVYAVPGIFNLPLSIPAPDNAFKYLLQENSSITREHDTMSTLGTDGILRFDYGQTHDYLYIINITYPV